MIAPGLSVSTKGRVPMSTDSKEIQYLYQILQALNNFAGLVTNLQTTMIVQSTAIGDTTITIPSNTWLISISAKANTHSETIDIGTTPGGTELTSGLAISTSAYTSINVNQFYETGQIIYITGATGSVTYNLLTSPQ